MKYWTFFFLDKEQTQRVSYSFSSVARQDAVPWFFFFLIWSRKGTLVNLNEPATVEAVSCYDLEIIFLGVHVNVEVMD